jgi:hypothetical protein
MKKSLADANKAIGRFVVPKKDNAKTPVYTPEEARKRQQKITKKKLKGGYSGAGVA